MPYKISSRRNIAPNSRMYSLIAPNLRTLNISPGQRTQGNFRKQEITRFDPATGILSAIAL